LNDPIGAVGILGEYEAISIFRTDSQPKTTPAFATIFTLLI